MFFVCFKRSCVLLCWHVDLITAVGIYCALGNGIPSQHRLICQEKNCHRSSSNKSWQIIKSWWSIIINTVITYPSLQGFPEKVSFKSSIVKSDVWSSSLHGVWCHVNSYQIDVLFYVLYVFVFHSVSWNHWNREGFSRNILNLFCGCLHCNSWSLKSWNNDRGIHRHRTKHLSLSSYSVMLGQSGEYFSGSCVHALMNST